MLSIIECAHFIHGMAHEEYNRCMKRHEQYLDESKEIIANRLKNKHLLAINMDYEKFICLSPDLHNVIILYTVFNSDTQYIGTSHLSFKESQARNTKASRLDVGQVNSPI